MLLHIEDVELRHAQVTVDGQTQLPAKLVSEQLAFGAMRALRQLPTG
jgi:hypothetical protein